MSRQRLTFAVIGALFVALLVVRGFVGQGLGRVYVQADQVSLAQVDEKGADGAVTRVWKSVPEAQATQRWTEWNQIAPKEYFEAVA